MVTVNYEYENSNLNGFVTSVCFFYLNQEVQPHSSNPMTFSDRCTCVLTNSKIPSNILGVWSANRWQELEWEYQLERLSGCRLISIPYVISDCCMIWSLISSLFQVKFNKF